MDQCDTAYFPFATEPQQFQVQFQKLARQFEQECQTIQNESHQIHGHIQLLEVFCGDTSELTQQVQDMGGSSQRISLSTADLSSFPGLQILFLKVTILQPEHIWISPTCKPWCAWSQLNVARSLSSFDFVQSQRLAMLYQLALGIVLLRHQFQKGRHLQWEQPRRSAMFRSPLLHELYQKTMEAQFVLCRLGDLCDPESNMPIQRGCQSERFHKPCLKNFMEDSVKKS